MNLLQVYVERLMGCVRLSLGAFLLALAATPAQSTIINFDMTSLSPSPVYDSVILDLNLSGGGVLSCSVRDGLDFLGAHVDGCAAFSPITYTSAGIVDGIFSINMGFGPGVIADGAPFAVGIKNGVRTGPLSGRVQGAVPEPSSLALFGIVLAGLGVARLRRRI